MEAQSLTVLSFLFCRLATQSCGKPEADIQGPGGQLLVTNAQGRSGEGSPEQSRKPTRFYKSGPATRDLMKAGRFSGSAGLTVGLVNPLGHVIPRCHVITQRGKRVALHRVCIRDPLGGNIGKDEPT
eukprot:1485247-Rhodomonas_salina.2